MGSRISSVCSVPNRRATRRAYGSSSKEGAEAPKPTEKVEIRWLVVCRMQATTALESMPPLRNTPNGTSLSRRSATASHKYPADAGCRLLPGEGLGSLSGGKAPVAAQAEVPLAKRGGMGGRQLGDLGEDGTLAGRIAKGEVVMEGVQIHVPGHRGMAQEGLDLGREEEHSSPVPVVERLLPEAIARQEEGGSACVPDGEGEHTAQVVQAPLAAFLVQVQDGLGIASRPEPMTSGLQTLPELLVVVDLPVEDDPEGSILVRHRLPAPRQVDDGETRHPDADGRLFVHPDIIRTAVTERQEHARKHARGSRADVPRNSTHDQTPPHPEATASRRSTRRPVVFRGSKSRARASPRTRSSRRSASSTAIRRRAAAISATLRGST